MSSKERFLDYDACTTDELRSFMEDRVGICRGSRSGRPKSSYVALLRQMDRDMTFHQFLDLPPELRLLVYRELLVVDAKRRKPKPPDIATLRSCRLVKKESEHVLYGENEIKVEISIEGQPVLDDSTSHRVHVPGMFHPPRFHCESFKDLGAALRVFPACLAIFRRVRIEIEMIDAQSPCLLEEARFQCFVLANLLPRTRARTIKISLAGSDLGQVSRDHILKPWTQLDPDMETKSKEVSGEVTTYLSVVQSKTAPEQNALTKWFDANVEATKFAHPTIGLAAPKQELLHFETNLDKIRCHVIDHAGSYSTAAKLRLREATTILKRMLADEKVRLAELETEDSQYTFLALYPATRPVGLAVV